MKFYYRIFFFQALERDCWTILNKPKPRIEQPKDMPADSSKKHAPPSDTHSASPPPTSSNKKSSQSKHQQANSQQTPNES
jgi:hypothetical protein